MVARAERAVQGVPDAIFEGAANEFPSNRSGFSGEVAPSCRGYAVQRVVGDKPA